MSRAFSRVFIDLIAFIPFWGIEPWALLPMVVISSQSIPLWAVTIWKFVGSGIIAPAKGGNVEAFFSMKRFTPQLSVSSPAAAKRIKSPLSSRFFFAILVMAVKIAVSPAFMSAEPLPKILPCSSTASYGGYCHFVLPCGTTSRWAAKIRAGLRLAEAMRAVRLALFWSHVSIWQVILCSLRKSAATLAHASSPLSGVGRALMRFFKSSFIVGDYTAGRREKHKFFVAD